MTVCPPSNKLDAIPEVATAIPILPSDLNLANIVLYKKVFPVPPIRNKLNPQKLKESV